MLKGNQYTVIDADMTYDAVNLVQKQLDLMLDDEVLIKTHTPISIL